MPILNMQNLVTLYAHCMGTKFKVVAICHTRDEANEICAKDETVGVISENNGLIFVAEMLKS